MLEEIEDEKATQLVRAASEAKQQALSLLVRSPREYEQVSEFVSQVKAKQKEIDGYRTYLKEPYLEGGRRVDAFFKPPLEFLKEAETAAKTKLLGYQEEQRRVAAEEQRRLDDKARKEREALEAKAKQERERVDAEAAEIRRKADAARDSGDLAQAVTMQNQATKLVEKSEIKAEALLSKASAVVAQKVHAYIPPVVGQSSRTIWKARVVDAALVPREYLVVNDKMLDQVAGATKGALKVPGVEFFSDQIMSARAAR